MSIGPVAFVELQRSAPGTVERAGCSVGRSVPCNITGSVQVSSKSSVAAHGQRELPKGQTASRGQGTCDTKGVARPIAKPVHIIDDAASQSSVLMWPKLLPFHNDTLASMMSQLMELAPWESIIGAKGRVVRKTCWITQQPCTCPYEYGGREITASN
eukprot:1330075-Karenia_brevis.AAC.1